MEAVPTWLVSGPGDWGRKIVAPRVRADLGVVGVATGVAALLG